MVWYNQYMKNTKEGVVKIMRKTNVKKISKVKQKMQSNSGITLVALVVTIIVLLILAFISIATLTGENGILGMAKKAKNENENATNDELAKLKQMEIMTKEAGEIPDINAEIDGLPAKKTLEELPGYIPIYTPEQFEKIASGESNYAISDLSGKQIGTYNMEPGAKYALMEDLDFSSMSNVKSVRGFTGELEGNGCYIRNVTIREDENSVKYNNIITGEQGTYSPAGLFQSIVNGTVKNLAVTNSSFSAVYERVGAIAGHADNATIENCYAKEIDFQDCLGAGIIGAVGKNGINISKCKAITIKGKYIAGIVNVTFGEANINNCQTISTDKNNYLASGIILDAKNKTKITNCKVQDISLLENGGIINICESGGQLEINNCTSKNLTFRGDGAGIVNYTACNDVTIENCKVENIQFLNQNRNSGIIRVNNGKENIKITNCSAKKLTGGVGAGIIDHTLAKNVVLEDCYVEDVTSNAPYFAGIMDTNQDSTEIKIENCVSKNLTVQHGVAGIVYSSDAKTANIKNCYVKGIKQEAGGENFAGVIAVENNNCVIEYCKVNDITSNRNSNAAGIIVYASGLKMKNCEVNNMNVQNEIGESIGGAIGVVMKNQGIENVNVSNVNIDVENTGRNIGGIVGTTIEGTISNCNVNNIKISSKLGMNSMGGIVGNTTSTKIQNCKIKDSELNLKAEVQSDNLPRTIGGIAGFAIKIENCVAENVKVDSSKEDITGTAAIVGHTTSYDSNINGCKVIGCQITGKHSTGGICGYGINAQDCTVENSTITSVESIGVGGIIGHSDNFRDSIIKNCKVTNTEIIGKESTGGICGAVATVVSGCTVENSKITSNGKYVGGIQGHGGYRERDSQKSITIENCNVNNTVIKGTQWVDYIQGRNSHKTDSDTDTTTEDKITNCNYDSKTTKN